MKTALKFFATAVTIAILSAFTAFDKAPSWTVDKAHSSIGFSVKHLFTPTIGTFDKYDMDLKFSPDDLKGSAVSVSIDVKSINTKNAKRDGHLQTEDFFDSKNYSTITFKSSSFSKNADGGYNVKGDLTMKDVTKEITIPFKVLGMKVVKGKTVAGLSADFKLNRNDYGVGTGSFAATTTIGDEVTVSIAMAITKSL